MKNKLVDLNNHLFAQVERLGDEDLAGPKLTAEIHRAKAMSRVAREVVNNARLAFEVHQSTIDAPPSSRSSVPEMLGTMPLGDAK